MTLKKLKKEIREELISKFAEEASGLAIWIDTEGGKADEYGYLAGLLEWLDTAIEKAYEAGKNSN